MNAEIVRALFDNYLDSGIVLWLRAWLAGDEARRTLMETALIGEG